MEKWLKKSQRKLDTGNEIYADEVGEMKNKLKDARDDLYTYNPQYEQLRELGRQIMQADTTKGSTVQGHLSEVNQAWDHLTALLGQKHQQYSAVANLWQQYNDAKQGNGEFELHANQNQLDQMNNRGLQLLEELKAVPNFEVGVLEQDMDRINHQWETANMEIEQHKENLEAQLNCWDQVQSGKEEVESWLNSMATKLNDSLQNFDDAISVESCLMKYKEEAPYFAEVLAEVKAKTLDLQELNNDKPIPVLAESEEVLQEQFDRAATMANQLESIMANFSDEREKLQKDIEEETMWLNKLKDKLGKCDDVSGTDADLIKRLQSCKDLQKELDDREKRVKALLDKTSALQTKYPSAETSNLAKDAVVLSKKFEAVQNRGDKIVDMLEGSLEQHCQDAQLQEARWINAAKEKVAWCGDIAGDRYSVEAKLATIKDLMASMKEGKKKKDLAASKVDAAKSVLPKDKQADLDRQKTQAEKDWEDLMDLMEQTQVKLEGSVDQLSAYDNKYDNLSKWLKDTEAKLRNQTALKPDLQGKVDQAELFADLVDDVERHQPQFDALRQQAQEISQSSGDGRTASYAGQLLSRYQALQASVREQAERCDQNVEDHQDYNNRHKKCIDWLEAVSQELEECNNQPVDQETLQAKLETVEDLMNSKEEGLAQFSAALEAGERLFPNTSNDGREGIRKELRNLREKWESFNDTLNDAQRSLESSKMQWSTFDENYDQLLKWVTDMECQIEHDNELCNTLQEKKAMLQHYRTRAQDVMSHQTMIDSVSDKGAALSSHQVKGKLSQLTNSYRALCQAAQGQVKTAEARVDQHQTYHDSCQQTRDWMAMTRDKLAVCSEVTGDRQALQNRLDRVQDLLTSLRDGEKKLKTAHTQGEKTCPQTAQPGQGQIQSELEHLTQEWEMLATKLGDTQTGTDSCHPGPAGLRRIV
ncbi:hypothetical protein FSP39_000625 [Pinctada imbricata]|uniref:Nesprin-1-like n=1 Tax=Pinctada imbricata TaxID=66713 RepID=A0AA88Y458_PINIB|nr:hypothetical protein FSP39_000625 [Pinctada imbricata]